MHGADPESHNKMDRGERLKCKPIQIATVAFTKRIKVEGLGPPKL